MEGERKPTSSSTPWLLLMGVGAAILWAWANPTSKTEQSAPHNDGSAQVAPATTTARQGVRQDTPAVSPRRSVASLVPTFLDDPAPTDSPNYFSAKQMSSGGILAGVSSCAKAARKSAPELAGTPEFVDHYCSCTVDAMRVNKGAATLDLAEHLPTGHQMKRCADWTKSYSSADGRSAFNNSAQENSLAVARLTLSCLEAISSEHRSATYSAAFCSCWADARRTHPKRSDLTPDEKVKCDLVADYLAETDRHMTVRQFKALGQASEVAVAPPPSPRPAMTAPEVAFNGGAPTPAYGTYGTAPRAVGRQVVTPLPLLDQSKPVHVDGYFRKNGTYVRPHTRHSPR